MQTILWHDYETSGADPAQDRPWQFAAVRTDLDLVEIGEPVTLFCKPALDVVPHPQACLVTGLSPQKVALQGVREREFVAEILQMIAVPQTCAAGYNSIRFDDEFTRYSLYRNLLDPYAREWRNGNSRWDLIDVVRTLYLLRPNALQWHMRDASSPSFRLEDLARVNNLAHENAHDALADVRATIALARRIKEREPGLFEYCWKLRDKRFVESKLEIADRKPFLHVSSRFPASRGCAALMAPLAKLRTQSNAVIALDLSWTPGPLGALSVDEIRDRIYTSVAGGENSSTRIPLKRVHLNRSPVVLPVAMLGSARAAELGINLRQCEENWRVLQNMDISAIDWDGVFAFESSAPRDVDLALYDGFVSDADRIQLNRIATMLPEELRDSKFHFQDARLGELLFRMRARNYPQYLTGDEQNQWNTWVRHKLETGEPYGLTLRQCEQEIDKLLGNGLTTDQREVLKELQEWLLRLRSGLGQA